MGVDVESAVRLATLRTGSETVAQRNSGARTRRPDAHTVDRPVPPIDLGSGIRTPPSPSVRIRRAIATAVVRRSPDDPSVIDDFVDTDDTDTPSDKTDEKETNEQETEADEMEIDDKENDESGQLHVQTKLLVGAADDPQEREADRFADRVVRSLQQPVETDSAGASATPAMRIQRNVSTLHAQHDVGVPRPVEERIRRRTAVGTPPEGSSVIGADGGAAQPEVAAEIAASRGGGRPLADGVRSEMEHSIGVDLGGVRIHQNAAADRLNRSLSSRAFTVGSDVYFADRQFAPQEPDGQHLLAHELAHVAQQGGAGTARAHRSTIIHREYAAHTVLSNAHLRDDTSWTKKKGPTIGANSVIFVDDANSKRKDTTDRIAKKNGEDVRWLGAINVRPGHVGPIPDKRIGFIREMRVHKQTGANATLVDSLRAQVVDILARAESLYPGMNGLFVRPGQADYDEQIKFLMEKHLRVGITGGFQGANPAQAAQAMVMTTNRLDRIRTGIAYLAEALDHWRTWLHPARAGEVALTGLKWMQSDLHQRGLGVVKVNFTKPTGGAAAFSAKTAFSVMVKPEDKSLEQALLGDNEKGADDEDNRSAAQKINEIVGLNTSDEALTTIKMASDEHYGAIIEFVNGESARDAFKNGGAMPIKQTFHETLVFAFLAGLDDLHRDNVFWSADGRPFLIDADNVASMNQMLQKDHGAKVQSGFGYESDDKGAVHPSAVAYHQEAEKNMKAIRDEDQTFNSKILAAMLTDDGKRTEIVEALREALAGKKGRIVPVRTQYWGDLLNTYPSHQNTNGVLDQHAAGLFIVEAIHPTEPKGGFDTRIGPGFRGTVGESDDGPPYAPAKEREQLRADFEAGVIPFYEYEFSSGKVFHNGIEVYAGINALEAAMDIIDAKFPGALG